MAGDRLNRLISDNVGMPPWRFHAVNHSLIGKVLCQFPINEDPAVARMDEEQWRIAPTRPNGDDHRQVGILLARGFADDPRE